MNHFCAGIGLLVVACHGHRIEFAGGATPGQHARGVLPGYRRPGLDLCPRQLRVIAAAKSALGNEVIDAAAPLGVAGIPVLHGGIFHFGAVLHHNLHNCCVELVLVAHRGGAPLEVAYI